MDWRVVGLILTGGLPATAAAADPVPFTCTILPGNDVASVQITNVLGRDSPCIVTCKFSTVKYDNNPEIACAKRVPAGKQVEMCLLTSGGDKLVKLTSGRAECTLVKGR